jgi:DNA-directed RNA polymerase specialized sigma24 family protein
MVRGEGNARAGELALVVRSTDDPAWAELVDHLWPTLLHGIRGSRTMGPFGRSEDHVREAALRVVERLAADGCRALGRYAEWREAAPGRTFDTWLRIVSTNVLRDYVRERVGRPSARPEGAPEYNARLVDSLAAALPSDELLGNRPPVTLHQTAREILEFAAERLPAAQLAALRAWLGGASFDEIASEQGLDGEHAARKLVRAALATLRRFAESGG